MKWRWRRRIKVAPGVNVNLSNSSAGVSLGGSAGRVSANTSGRVTAGQSLPGTGLYSQTTLATGKGKKRQPPPPGMVAPPGKRRGCMFYAGWGAALLLGLFGCVVIANMVGGNRSDNDAPERAGVVTLPTEETSAPIPTWTNTPETAPTLPALATPTPETLATIEAPTATPAQPTPSWSTMVNGVEFASDCLCDQGNTLNCSSFAIPKDAQACYLRCMELTGLDVHDMDGDKDGTACEWKY